MHHLYNLIDKIDQELESVSKKAGQNNSPISSSELQRIDLLSHALKSLECVCQMREGSEDDYSGRSRRSYDSGEYSGRRMRSARTGRWYSGDGNSMNGSMGSNSMGNSMDGGSMGGNSMNSNRSYNSYGGGQDMAQKLREMASMMEQQQGNN